MSLSGPIRDKKLVPKTDDLNLTQEQLELYQGIDGDPNYYDVPKIKKAPFGEDHHDGVYGSGIRIGPDRMNERLTPTGEDYVYGNGYGGQGAFGCSAVDIYAGLASHHTAGGKVPKYPVNPSADKDAARVYVSAMCDVDDMFDLPDGTLGNIKGKSAAVVKADHVRIDGREGVKITTGVDIKNSKNKDIRSVPFINLIAGGNVGEDKMHPIPKGKNLLKALNDIVNNINELSSIVDNFLMFQHKFNTALMTHKHPSPTSIGIGVGASGNAAALCGGQTLISFDCAAAGFDALVSGLQVKKDMMLHLMSAEGTKIQRMKRFSSEYINSRQVFTS